MNLERFLNEFTDEELAEMGLTRQEILADPQKAMNSIRDEAMNQWIEQEEGVEELVALAQEDMAAVIPTPGHPVRVSQMSEFYGNRLLELGDKKLVGVQQIFQLFLFAVFKLAEERNKNASSSGEANPMKEEGKQS